MFSNSLVFYLVLAQGISWAAPTQSLLEAGSHCVAYRAHKVTFFVSKSEVVGKNCDISAQVLPEVGGLYHIEVNIPLRSFDSGDEDRDKDVVKILKGEEKPEITFRSKALSADQWRDLFNKKEFDMDGELTIGNKTFPIKVRSNYVERDETAEVDGIARVRFQDFDLRPPNVGGGIVAKAKPDLELHFHLISQRILGADSIRLVKAKQ